GAFPSYAYPTTGACSSCSGGLAVNYAPACNTGCGTCDTGCSSCAGASCSNCADTSSYSPDPENESTVEPTPATPPKDDFEKTTPHTTDSEAAPRGGRGRGGFKTPPRARAGWGNE